MNIKRTVSILGAGAVVAVMGLGLMAFQSGSAQASAPRQAAFSELAHPGRGGGGEFLAEALGIALEELEAAHEQAMETAVEEAVEAGLITEAQADAILSGQGRFGGRMGGWLAQGGIDFNAHLADALGITVEELQAAHEQAAELQLEAAVESGRITQEQADLMQARKALTSSDNFRTAMRAAFESAVEAAVESGLITQAQADLILENLPEDGGLGGFGGRRGPGGFNHPGGFGGPHGPISPQAPASPASST
ncbi:MAG: hypothetical protein R3335_06795 [Anaerolineales bacterium]|nr:hypothetical protein [Anaerolineales bacterium]